MLNCRLKGSLVLVCLACIWRSTDHYGKVRYYLSQVNLSSYNFFDFFYFQFFFGGEGDFYDIISLFYFKIQRYPFVSNCHGNTIIWQFLKLWFLDWWNGLSRRLVSIIYTGVASFPLLIIKLDTGRRCIQILMTVRKTRNSRRVQFEGHAI